MLRINRLTDYGLVILVCLAESKLPFLQANDIAQKTGLSRPTVSKLLKKLTKSGFLDSKQGVKGGYQLSCSPNHLNIAKIITALEGPIAITACNLGKAHCAIEHICATKTPWTLINQKIMHTLKDISLADLLNQTHRKIA